jgi:hypothetical protein
MTCVALMVCNALLMQATSSPSNAVGVEAYLPLKGITGQLAFAQEKTPWAVADTLLLGGALEAAAEWAVEYLVRLLHRPMLCPLCSCILIGRSCLKTYEHKSVARCLSVLQDAIIITPSPYELNLLADALTTLGHAARCQESCRVALVANGRLAGSLSATIEKLLPFARQGQQPDGADLASGPQLL